MAACDDALGFGPLLEASSRGALGEPPSNPPTESPARAVTPLSLDAGSVTCLPDAFEPNDEPPSASPLAPGQSVEAVACSEDDFDYYRLEAPAPEGRRFSVRVSFSHALGDIDLVLSRAADEEVVDEAVSVTDDEVVSAVSDGGQYLLEVSLFEAFAATGTPYRVEVFVAAEADNDCCSESAAPGCRDDATLECVCDADPYCCAGEYDAACVQLAVSECGVGCSVAANPGSCCAESSASGCADPVVEACVCGLAPFCCNGSYDGACADLARGLCGADCTGEGF